MPRVTPKGIGAYAEEGTRIMGKHEKHEHDYKLVRRVTKFDPNEGRVRHFEFYKCQSKVGKCDKPDLMKIEG